MIYYWRWTRPKKRSSHYSGDGTYGQTRLRRNGKELDNQTTQDSVLRSFKTGLSQVPRAGID